MVGGVDGRMLSTAKIGNCFVFYKRGTDKHLYSPLFLFYFFRILGLLCELSGVSCYGYNLTDVMQTHSRRRLVSGSIYIR